MGWERDFKKDTKKRKRKRRHCLTLGQQHSPKACWSHASALYHAEHALKPCRFPYEATGMLLSFLYNYLAPFPHFPLLTFQTEPPKLHPNPYASVKYIEFEEKKVSFILSQPALAPSCRDQRLLGLSKTFCVCLWSRKQPLFHAGVPRIFFQAIYWSQVVLEASNQAAPWSPGPDIGRPRGFPATARHLMWEKKGARSPAKSNPGYTCHSWISSSRGYYTGTPLTKVFCFV